MIIQLGYSSIVRGDGRQEFKSHRLPK